MHTGYQLGAVAVTGVVLKQQLASLFVQRRLSIRTHKQTLHGHKYVFNSVGRLPVLLQRIDANFA